MSFRWPTIVILFVVGVVLSVVVAWRCAMFSRVVGGPEALSSNGSGQATMNIIPPLRKSPANNAVLTLSNIDFQLILISKSRHSSARPPSAYGNFMCEFAELLS